MGDSLKEESKRAGLKINSLQYLQGSRILTNTMLRTVLRRIQKPSLSKMSHRHLTSSLPPDDPNPIAKVGLKELWPVCGVLVGLFGVVLSINPVRESYPRGMDANKWKD